VTFEGISARVIFLVENDSVDYPNIGGKVLQILY
jgi:hypothetical protein